MSQKPMRSTEPLSLRARLAIIMSAVFLMGMLALYAAARSSAEAASNRSFDRLLLGSVLSITETIAVAGGRVQIDLPYAALDMLSAAPEDRVFYRVLGPAGELVTGDPRLPWLSTLDRRNGPEAFAGPDTPVFFDAMHSGEKVRFAILGRRVAEPDTAGWLWVQVGQTRRAREELTTELVLNALTPIGAMTLLALGVAWFGIGGALLPLTRLTRELEAREPGDLHPLSTSAPAEIRPLVESLNDFMRRLDANILALKLFIAEAAHQMRTPLAAILAQAQVASAGDDADRRHGLEAVERNTAKLSRLLQQLLSDATVAHRADVRALEDFDLLKVVRSAVRESTPMALEREVRVESALKAAPFTGDALLVGEAVKNLIDNAFTHGHAAEDGLNVRVAEEGSDYVISVADRGPGVPPHMGERMFERFVRSDARAPGAGLGLSIVRKAMLGHGGAVTVENREGGGLVVRLHMPRPRS